MGAQLFLLSLSELAFETDDASSITVVGCSSCLRLEGKGSRLASSKVEDAGETIVSSPLTLLLVLLLLSCPTSLSVRWLTLRLLLALLLLLTLLVLLLALLAAFREGALNDAVGLSVT